MIFKLENTRIPNSLKIIVMEYSKIEWVYKVIHQNKLFTHRLVVQIIVIDNY